MRSCVLGCIAVASVHNAEVIGCLFPFTHSSLPPGDEALDPVKSTILRKLFHCRFESLGISPQTLQGDTAHSTTLQFSGVVVDGRSLNQICAYFRESLWVELQNWAWIRGLA